MNTENDLLAAVAQAARAVARAAVAQAARALWPERWPERYGPSGPSGGDNNTNNKKSKRHRKPLNQKTNVEFTCSCFRLNVLFVLYHYIYIYIYIYISFFHIEMKKRNQKKDIE